MDLILIVLKKVVPLYLLIGERVLAAGTSLESGQILKILLELLELKFQPKPQVSKNNLRSNSFYQPTKKEKSTQCSYPKKEKEKSNPMC